MIVIEKDKAIKGTWEEPSYSDPLNVLTEIRDRLNTLPTIDIVRCRECRRWSEVSDPKVDYGLCERWGRLITTRGTYFCSDGKRRDEDERSD